MNDESRVSAVRDKARRLAAEIIWTHKIMEKRAEALRKHAFILQLLTLLFTAATATGLIVSITGESILATKISTGFAAVTLFCELFSCAYGYPTRIQNTEWSAKGFLELREKTLGLLCDLKHESCAIDDAEFRFEKFESCYIELCRAAPSTDGKAVDEATVSLKEKKDSTYEDEEIDELLPEALRSVK